MNHKLQKTLQSDLALATQEDHLIFHARKLYQMGFTPQHISLSQMAALGELIRTASNLEEAQQRVEAWLKHQMDKLKAKAERSGKRTSWLLAPKTGTGGETLGHTLIQRIVENPYLHKAPAGDLDRLTALQRFWDRLHTLYRYEEAMHEAMPLANLGPLNEEGENS